MQLNWMRIASCENVGRRRRDSARLQSLKRRVLLFSTALALYSGCLWAVDAVSRVKVALTEGGGVMFCQDCQDPLREGSYLPALTPYYNPREYFVTGELVYGVPNQADQSLFNEREISGRVVVLDRGKVSFAKKVQRAQSARALAVIIIDDEQCADSSSPCFDDFVTTDGGLTIVSGQNDFLASDSFSAWRDVEIPSLLISSEDGVRLRQFMNVLSFDLNGDEQYMSPLE